MGARAGAARAWAVAVLLHGAIAVMGRRQPGSGKREHHLVLVMGLADPGRG